MKIWVPMLVYLAVQSITPGPNNLTCLYLGGAYGLKGVKKFLTASMTCLFIKSFLCGALNAFLSGAAPKITVWLKWVGAAYMLYLSWMMIRSGWREDTASGGTRETAGFRDGVLLQVFNTKSWIASLSVFAVYVTPVSRSIGTVLWVSAVFFLLALISSLIWAVFGSALKSFIDRHKKIFSVIMGLSLVWCAVTALL